MWWLLAREVLLIRGKISRQTGFVFEDKKEIMPDLYFYRDPEEQEKEDLAEVHEIKEAWASVISPETSKIDEVSLVVMTCVWLSLFEAKFYCPVPINFKFIPLSKKFEGTGRFFQRRCF